MSWSGNETGNETGNEGRNETGNEGRNETGNEDGRDLVSCLPTSLSDY